MTPIVRIVFNVKTEHFEVYCRDEIVSRKKSLIKATKALAAYVKSQSNA